MQLFLQKGTPQQTNKVKKMINKVDYLHSLDSLNLANYIDKYRFKELPCFIQVNLTNSQTKHGIKKEELLNFLDALKKYPKVKVVGLMTMTEESQNSEEKYVEVAMYTLPPHSILMLCSDGLCDMITSREMKQILQHYLAF